MGEVYRATDARLSRDVAIKVLPAAYAADPERLQRFEQEARAAAALNHPNILSVLDVVQHDGSPCIVSELLEGESLRDVIGGGALPARKAVEYGRQVAIGLAAAHEKGIVHRDLKPDNVFVTHDGRVKILDFGLAKLTQAEPLASGMTALPTTPMVVPQTVTGMVMGTIGYMAPEQVRGVAADYRADIFALGVLLYEMLSGSRAFAGETTADVMSAILRADPPEFDPGAAIPPALARIIHRCLEKQPAARFQSARDLAFALEALSSHTITATTVAAIDAPVRIDWRGWLLRGVAALVLVGVSIAGTWAVLRPIPASPQRVSIVAPLQQPLAFGCTPCTSLAISPDGRTVVYVGQSLPDTRLRLYLRTLDSMAVNAMQGTEGAHQPFFSPDGRWIGYFGNAGDDQTVYSLRKVQVGGGSPVTILNRVNGGVWSNGAWLPDGTIVFAAPSQGLLRVSADGGTPQTVTTLNTAGGERWHSNPALLPGGALLFGVTFSTTRSPQIEAVAPDGSGRRVVLENASAPHYLVSGHLLFQRDDLVMLAPFDRARAIVTGPAVPLDDAIRRDGTPSSPGTLAQIAVSAAGTVAYVGANDEAGSALTLVGVDGKATSIGRRERFSTLRRSPDGRQVAASVAQADGTTGVEIVDLVRGTSTRLAREGNESGPAWHPDDRQLAVFGRHEKESGIFIRDLGGAQRLLVPSSDGAFLRNMDWSPDGTQLAYTRQTGGLEDIYIVNVADPSKPMALLQSKASENSPRFSPDGRWLAFASDESGRYEVYVQRLPAGTHVRVSREGSQGFAWSPDGRSIFYSTFGDSPAMMRAPLTFTGDMVAAGEPTKLFEMRAPGPTGAIEEYGRGNNLGSRFDVLPDGRFIMIRGADPRGTREIVLIQNFAAEAQRLLAAK
jgi:Tol biopolymer transport system component